MPTVQTTLPPAGTATLLIKANSGSVTVEKMVGGAWTVLDTFTADGGYIYAFGGSATRITPTGGAAFEVTA